MYADGSVRGDGEGGPGDSENEDGEDLATDNGLIGVLPDDLPEVVTVVCRQHAGDYYSQDGDDQVSVPAVRRGDERRGAGR